MGKTSKPTQDATPEAVDDSDYATSQESKPVPWMAGTRKVAATWISPIYQQHAEPAPSERPGKK